MCKCEFKLYYRSKGGHDQENYGFEFTFFNEIIPEVSAFLLAFSMVY